MAGLVGSSPEPRFRPQSSTCTKPEHCHGAENSIEGSKMVGHSPRHLCVDGGESAKGRTVVSSYTRKTHGKNADTFYRCGITLQKLDIVFSMAAEL